MGAVLSGPNPAPRGRPAYALDDLGLGKGLGVHVGVDGAGIGGVLSNPSEQKPRSW